MLRLSTLPSGDDVNPVKKVDKCPKYDWKTFPSVWKTLLERCLGKCKRCQSEGLDCFKGKIFGLGGACQCYLDAGLTKKDCAFWDEDDQCWKLVLAGGALSKADGTKKLGARYEEQ